MFRGQRPDAQNDALIDVIESPLHAAGSTGQCNTLIAA
jgi:hypothetical protein